MNEFALHPQLAADTWPVCTLSCCEVLLMDDSRFPWLILVPSIPAARELHELADEVREIVYAEIQLCTQALLKLVNPYKINVATLGNQVDQLHIHVIARSNTDSAWPAPVWGYGERSPYADAQVKPRLDRLKVLLG